MALTYCGDKAGMASLDMNRIKRIIADNTGQDFQHHERQVEKQVEERIKNKCEMLSYATNEQLKRLEEEVLTLNFIISYKLGVSLEFLGLWLIIFLWLFYSLLGILLSVILDTLGYCLLFFIFQNCVCYGVSPMNSHVCIFLRIEGLEFHQRKLVLFYPVEK